MLNTMDAPFFVKEGKSKKFFKVSDELNFMCFKPHLRSVTSNREGNIIGTDHERLISCFYFMQLLEQHNISTHLDCSKILNWHSMEGLIVKDATTIPLEFICRYYAAGSIVRTYPGLVVDGQKFKYPLYKFDVKQDVSVMGVDDPTINENYIVGLEILTKTQFRQAKKILASVGEIVRKDLLTKGIKLIDMKIELGFDKNKNIIVIDEISQDCIRANDVITDKSLTKDAYRNMETDAAVLDVYKRFNYRVCQ